MQGRETRLDGVPLALGVGMVKPPNGNAANAALPVAPMIRQDNTPKDEIKAFMIFPQSKNRDPADVPQFLILGHHVTIFNMRIFFQRFKLILSTLFIAHLFHLSPVHADGGEDYYNALRKLKKFDPATVEQLKRKHIDAEQIEKVNAISRKNKQHNAERDRKNPWKKEGKTEEGQATAPAVKPVVSKKTNPVKESRPESTSAPVKVDSDAPDELSFPGTGDEAPAPAPKKKN